MNLIKSSELSEKISNIPVFEPDEWEKKAIEEYKKRKKEWKLEWVEVTEGFFDKYK